MPRGDPRSSLALQLTRVAARRGARRWTTLGVQKRDELEPPRERAAGSRAVADDAGDRLGRRVDLDQEPVRRGVGAHPADRRRRAPSPRRGGTLLFPTLLQRSGSAGGAACRSWKRPRWRRRCGRWRAPRRCSATAHRSQRRRSWRSWMSKPPSAAPTHWRRPASSRAAARCGSPTRSRGPRSTRPWRRASARSPTGARCACSLGSAPHRWRSSRTSAPSSRRATPSWSTA